MKFPKDFLGFHKPGQKPQEPKLPEFPINRERLIVEFALWVNGLSYCRREDAEELIKMVAGVVFKRLREEAIEQEPAQAMANVEKEFKVKN